MPENYQFILLVVGVAVLGMVIRKSIGFIWNFFLNVLACLVALGLLHWLLKEQNTVPTIIKEVMPEKSEFVASQLMAFVMGAKDRAFNITQDYIYGYFTKTP